MCQSDPRAGTSSAASALSSAILPSFCWSCTCAAALQGGSFHIKCSPHWCSHHMKCCIWAQERCLSPGQLWTRSRVSGSSSSGSSRAQQSPQWDLCCTRDHSGMGEGQGGGRGCHPPFQMGDHSKGQELSFLCSLVLQKTPNKDNNTKFVPSGSKSSFQGREIFHKEGKSDLNGPWMHLGSFGKPEGRGGAEAEAPEPLCCLPCLLLTQAAPSCFCCCPGSPRAARCRSSKTPGVCKREREKNEQK